jgi:hypothetical protein
VYSTASQLRGCFISVLLLSSIYSFEGDQGLASKE